MMKRLLGCLTLLVAFAGQAEAALIAGPIPDNLTVVFNGLRWAYVSPVAQDNWPGNTLLQPADNGNVGWRFATTAELALRPNLALFQALPGGSAAAVPYWNTLFTHVDEGNYAAGLVTSVRFNNPGAPPGAQDFWETIYVKDLAAQAVPEPATLAMFGVGALGLVGAALRRRRRVA